MLGHCKVGPIVFFVSDLARSVGFYRDTLGLPIAALDGHDGPFAMGDVGELALVLIPRPARAGESPVVVFSLDGGIDDHAEVWPRKAWKSWCRSASRPMAGCRWIFSIRTATC